MMMMNQVVMWPGVYLGDLKPI